MTYDEFANEWLPVHLANFPAYRKHIIEGGDLWFREQFAKLQPCAVVDAIEGSRQLSRDGGKPFSAHVAYICDYCRNREAERARVQQIRDWFRTHGPSNCHEIADGTGLAVDTVREILKREFKPARKP